MFLIFVFFGILIVACLGKFIFIFLTMEGFDFWKKRNVRGPKPQHFFGNYKECALGRVHETEFTRKIYENYPDEKMIGTYMMTSPVLVLRDLDLIKDVLSKHFSAFSDRGTEICEPLSQHFFNLRHSTSHQLKRNLSPVFTHFKIKNTFAFICDVADCFVSYVEELAEKDDCLECCALLSKFTTEVIGEYGFGMNPAEVSELIQVNSKQKSRILNQARRFLRNYMPRIYKLVHYFLCDKKKEKMFVSKMREIEQGRRRNFVNKNDYFSALLNLRDNSDEFDIEITDTFLAAQAYVFFTAGADTVSLIVSNAFYELAFNYDMQNKLREEIYEMLQADAKVTFENLKNLQYLDQIYKETLRKYPLRNIIRKSKKEYTFSNTNVTIPKNTHIIIPHYAIHHDPTIYPNPNCFLPERFNSKNKISHPMSYIPFGYGPRNCIGSRFSQYLIKIIMVTVIKNFELKLGNNLRNENDPRKVLLTPKGGIRLRFKKISNNLE